jgi:DNA (cytosine-5)-methyltransferase 1
MNRSLPTYYEFFAGGGMARAGLGPGWRCVFANDFDAMKAATYVANWGDHDLLCADVASIDTQRLAGKADLAWASFPCQDLSLAGNYAGLSHAASTTMTRSGTFWPFWRLMKALKTEGRAPRMIVLENVYGTLTSHDGKDFAAISSALSGANYRFGAIVIDALRFVPQSRQRVFFIAVDEGFPIPANLIGDGPTEDWHPRALVDAYAGISAAAKRKWHWWSMPRPALRNAVFADLIEDQPTGVRWHTQAETAYLLSLMSPVHKTKLKAAKASGVRKVGAVYRRTRPGPNGDKRQRAEVRFDDVAGCLRTPRGGSSRQTILVVEGDKVRSRLLSPREAARLMGLADDYKLPARYNDAYHVAGDGVCVPVVRHIAESLLEPILAHSSAAPSLAAE